MILANFIGAIPLSKLVSWADEIILAMDTPPNFIIDLALGAIPIEPQELDIVRNEMTESESVEITRMISEKLEKDEIDLSELGGICYKLALISKGHICDLLHWISDEIYLCSEGVKSLPESLPLIKSTINEIVATRT